jgi:hypothetical protein
MEEKIIYKETDPFWKDASKDPTGNKSALSGGLALLLQKAKEQQEWYAEKAKEAPSSVSSSVGLEGPVDLLRLALNMMDKDGKEIPGNSTAMWTRDWDELRAIIFIVYEILNEKAD